MNSSKTATLSSLLVSKKTGDAPRPEHPGLAQAQTPTRPGRRIQASAEQEAAYYKALTLKVDKPRFSRLKALGVDRNLPSQALMTEALDLLFAKHRV